MSKEIGVINHIVVIQSLPIGDVQSGTALYDDVIRRQIERLESSITSEFFNVNSKNEFVEILKYITANAIYIPGGIVIHLEMHGSDKLDGLVLSDHSMIEWEELVTHFRNINVLTCDKLFITMATCFGRYLSRGVDPYNKSPYSGYISASKSILPEEIIDDFSDLFEKVILDQNIVLAYRQLDISGSNFYYKDSRALFVTSIKDVRDIIDNDPQFKQELKDEFEKSGIAINDEFFSSDMELFLKLSFDDIVKRQKASFDFPDCN